MKTARGTLWMRTGILLLAVAPAEDDQPYACPSCGTTLFETCPSCGRIRHSLLPACQACGAMKEIAGDQY